MKVIWIALGFCLISVSINLSNALRYTYVDILRDSIKTQQWDKDEELCLGTMLSILDHAKNFTLWAVWILDSLQPPAGQLFGQRYHLGNYDECLQPQKGFLLDPEVPRTQYCLVNVTLTVKNKVVNPADYVWINHNDTADFYLKKPSKFGRVLSSMFLGVCVPETCKPSSAAKIAKSILQTGHFGALSNSANIQTTNCDNAEGVNVQSSWAMIFVQLFLILTATSIFCTYYVRNNNGAPSSFVNELARSFCLKRNMDSLTRVRDEEVYSMNFLRIATCLAVVNLHYVMLVNAYFSINGLAQEYLMDKYGHVVTHADIVVDTFLALSGLLFTRGLFSDRSQNPLKFLWKRYIRLAAALTILLFYTVALSDRVAQGPIWQTLNDEHHRVCVDNWLLSLFMIGNVFRVEEICLPHTWYVPLDYQLCVLTAILYMIYKRNKIIGKCIFIVAFILSNIYPGLVTYVNEYPPLVFYGVESLADFRKNVVFNHFYIKSYCRAGPFMVGMVMGYIMFTFKPKDYRMTIGTLWSYLIVIFSVLLMIAVTAFGHHYYLVNEPVSNAIYVALNRTIWGMAVCTVIGASEYGHLPILNSLFSWYHLVPLSRLTYGVYLTHFLILQFLFFSMRTTFNLDLFVSGMETSGVMVYSLAASLLVWLLVEAPLININNMMIDYTWRKQTVNTSDTRKCINGGKKDVLIYN
ncbi:nose resistant to fluoxetine protein 6-like isoform X2 [Amyelois transitella]|uniref:nose resistant to fluoxetine protein 6-like isoform X2 n=1 Tax=Amyelois transitella TaxID=680683 RepID=UPI00298FFEBB|nr:nose resistant to fluoxetine protein 6-like isoform X2 [Amyelois transitella]